MNVDSEWIKSMEIAKASHSQNQSTGYIYQGIE